MIEIRKPTDSDSRCSSCGYKVTADVQINIVRKYASGTTGTTICLCNTCFKEIQNTNLETLH